MPRFVIQQHTCEQQVHWDLMLDKDGELATWQVLIEPTSWGFEPILCRHIFNHRLIYLTYQGELTNNRGYVRIAAQGEFHTEEFTENYWRLSLTGDKIMGVLELRRLEGNQWQLNFTGE
ncbi:MAG: hypothetical protein GY869_30310 [Planctomycetes bacterium]|nr:hypothetical protein [Planctomycetota bacterium]